MSYGSGVSTSMYNTRRTNYLSQCVDDDSNNVSQSSWNQDDDYDQSSESPSAKYFETKDRSSSPADNSESAKKASRKRANTSSSGGGENKRTANKVCRVCGDKAFSYNFNVITCESCKAFFRRNANKEKDIRCPFDKVCDINIHSRRFCQRCRLDKCFDVGMKKEWIMSDEARMEKRQRVEENRERRLLDALGRGKDDDSQDNNDDNEESQDVKNLQMTVRDYVMSEDKKPHYRQVHHNQAVSAHNPMDFRDMEETNYEMYQPTNGYYSQEYDMAVCSTSQECLSHHMVDSIPTTGAGSTADVTATTTSIPANMDVDPTTTMTSNGFLPPQLDTITDSTAGGSCISENTDNNIITSDAQVQMAAQQVQAVLHHQQQQIAAAVVAQHVVAQMSVPPTPINTLQASLPTIAPAVVPQMTPLVPTQIDTHIDTQIGAPLGSSIGAQLVSHMGSQLGSQPAPRISSQIGVPIGNQMTAPLTTLSHPIGSQIVPQSNTQLHQQLDMPDEGSRNQTMSQVVNQQLNQLINQPINSPMNNVINASMSQSMDQLNQQMHQQISQTMDHTLHQAINNSLTMDQTIKSSISQPMNRLMEPPMNQTIGQSLNMQMNAQIASQIPNSMQQMSNQHGNMSSQINSMQQVHPCIVSQSQSPSTVFMNQLENTSTDLITVPKEMLLKLIQNNAIRSMACSCTCACGRYPPGSNIVEEVTKDLLNGGSSSSTAEKEEAKLETAEDMQRNGLLPSEDSSVQWLNSSTNPSVDLSNYINEEPSSARRDSYFNPVLMENLVDIEQREFTSQEKDKLEEINEAANKWINDGLDGYSLIDLLSEKGVPLIVEGLKMLSSFNILTHREKISLINATLHSYCIVKWIQHHESISLVGISPDVSAKVSQLLDLNIDGFRVQPGTFNTLAVMILFDFDTNISQISSVQGERDEYAKLLQKVVCSNNQCSGTDYQQLFDIIPEVQDAASLLQRVCPGVKDSFLNSFL